MAFQSQAYPLGAFLLAACASLDPADDVAGLRESVQQRAGADLSVPADDDALAATVRDLLQQPLTETAAVRIMVLHNHRVRALCERLAIGRAELVQAGLLRNPVFDGDARFLFDGGTELELGLAQPFLDLFWRPLREHVAEREFAAARLLVTDALVRLVFDVRRAFVDLRGAARLVALQRDALQIAESAHQLTVELHAAGNTTDQALALERAGETRARLDLAAAELAEVEAREALQVLLGLWGADTAWTVADEPAPDPLSGLDTERVESRAVAASLDLAARRAGIDAAAQRAGLASWRGWLPDASVGVTAIRESNGDWGLGPHLSLQLPLFDNGTGQRAKAEATLRAAMHDHVQVAVEVRSAARRLRERVVRLAARERFQREVHLPQRAVVLRTTLQTYNAMQIGVFDVLRQRRLQLADQIEHAVVQQAALHARLDLQELFAGALPDVRNKPADRMPMRAMEAEPERGH